MSEKPIVVIGGVAAGMSAASQLKRQLPDKKVIVVEKGDFISYGACGMPFYISGQIKDYRKLIVLTPEKAIRERNIEILLKHEATKIEPKEKVVYVKNLNEDKEIKINYEKLVIATGSSAILPEITGINTYGVLF